MSDKEDNLWLPYEEWKALREWYKQKELMFELVLIVMQPGGQQK